MGEGVLGGVYYYCLIANNHEMEVTYRNSIYLASVFVYFPGWAQGGGLTAASCSMCLFLLGPSVSAMNAFLIEMVKVQGSRADCACAFQAFGCFARHIVLLACTSHMAKFGLERT